MNMKHVNARTCDVWNKKTRIYVDYITFSRDADIWMWK